jgi:hypothetical protein
MSQPVSSARAERSAAPGRAPDFYLVGHAKCGTTAMWQMLRSHPQIFMPERKEPQFFARNPQPPVPGEPKRFEQTGRGAETMEEYLALFSAARADQRVGEASTFYLWSPDAPARIAAARPDARIVALLREPAAFLRSLHLQMMQNGAETERDLRRALELEPARREGREIPAGAHWPAALMYSDRVRYAEQLRRYHTAFGRDQVLVLLYDEFRQDNAETARKVLRFLDVDPSVALAPVQANPSVEVRSVRFSGFMRDFLRNARTGRTASGRAARAAARTLTSETMRRRTLHPLRRRLLFARAPAPDEALMAELRARFRPEVEAASEYLGRDLLALWGYER